MNALTRMSLLILIVTSSACATLSYRGAMIDARDAIAERHYGRALDDLDRASRAKPLTSEEAREVEALSTLCRDRVETDRPLTADRAQ